VAGVLSSVLQLQCPSKLQLPRNADKRLTHYRQGRFLVFILKADPWVKKENVRQARF